MSGPEFVGLRLVGVSVRRPEGADAVDISDLTAAARTGTAWWEEGNTLLMPLDRVPTEAEATAIRRRLVTVDADDEAQLLDLLAAAASPLTPAWAMTTIRAELARYGEAT